MQAAADPAAPRYTPPVTSIDAPTLIFIAVALLAGALLGWWLAARTGRERLAAELRVAAAEAESALSVQTERARNLEQQRADSRTALVNAERQAAEQNTLIREQASRITGLETELAATVRLQAENEVRLQARLAEAEARNTDIFKSVAAEILDEKTAKFTETNQTRLTEILDPFRERLKELQKRIEDNQLAEATERRSLKEELKRLMDLNQQVSLEAHNLTTALKGQAKTQGNWGEMILETVLGAAGLARGREYVVQDSRRNEDGDRQQPDVVINLPDNRHLVVDSKVSLVAFERYANAPDDEARETALAEHVQSVRSHVKLLSDKDYPALYGLGSLDFVLLFVPIEPAFFAAVQGDPGLYQYAWKKNIVLVSPTTLMATARVVENVWRLERQNRNALLIAQEAGKMYDKFVGFCDELQKVEKGLQGAGKALDDAVRKLHTGKGNLVGRALKLQHLGATANKALPPALTNQIDPLDDDPDTAPSPPDPDADPALRH